MNRVIAKSLKDIFSFDVISFVIKISLASMGLTVVISYIFWHKLVSIVSLYLSSIPWSWLQTTGVTVVTFFVSYILFTIVLSLLTSLYSEKLLIKLAKKHYPNTHIVGVPSITKSLLITLKATAIFILLFIVLFLTLFIPIIGQIIMLYLWSILLKEPTIYDVGALFIEDKERLKAKREKTRTLAMVASLFNYIPIFNIFAPVFAQIMFLHHILKDKN